VARTENASRMVVVRTIVMRRVGDG